MCRQNHGVAVDYYALGVIAYECMIGKVLIGSLFENNKNSLETIFGKRQEGNQRPDFVKASAN